MPELASAPSQTSASDLISSLRGRSPRLATALAAGQMAWPAARILRAKARERSTFTVKVPGDDGMYDDLHEWVLSLLPASEQRALVARTSRNYDTPAAMSSSGLEPVPALRLRYDGTREQAITVAGHRIVVIVADNGPAGDGDRTRWVPPQILFAASSAAGRNALLAEMENVLRRTHARKPAFWMLNKWGEWARLDDLPARDLDSVILPEGQLERLTGDVARFLAAEDEYVRRCVPWHRGHLYEGPPGTGKTSVARAVASHFGMDVWYLPLADLENDGELLRVANRIGPRSMLLLEDVDVFHAATKRTDDSGVTLSGLLNALDGIATPHGLLTVLTTNSPEVLDHAIVRAGRIDLVEHFAAADAGQVARLVARWYGQPVPAVDGVGGVAAAEVVEACKRHDEPAAVLAELAGKPPEVTAA